MSKLGMLLLVLVLFCTSAGCYQSPDTTLYEPHVYKGAEDPLRSKLQDGGLHQTLEGRFKKVQTDR